MNRTIYYIFLLGVLLLASCDDFLDQKPRHNLTLENSVTDYRGAMNILNGMYSVVASIGGYPDPAQQLGGATYVALSVQAGFMKNSDYEANYQMGYKEGYKDNPNAWQAYYTLVNAANAAIQGIGNLDVKKYPSPETKASMLAEAKCMRAWAYAHLFWLYGHWWDADESAYGIFWREEMANLNNLQVKRSTVGESYTHLFADLDEAILHTPDYTSALYLSKQMAQVLKAKLLLYRGAMRKNQQDLKEALDLVLEIKTTAPATWGMEADMAAMYDKAWDSKEVLWARYLGDSKSTGQMLEYTYSYGVGINNEYYDIPDAWLKADSRYEVVMDSARAPDAWNNKNLFVPVKLYRGGQYVEPAGKYATYYFRYPELLLMEAELKARLEDYSVQDALKPLNEMRAARTNPVLPALSASSKSELLRKIFQEICMELFLENGSEYFASLRFINDTDNSSAQNKPWIYTLKEDVVFSENQYCWPIPEDEMISNFQAEQNPELGK